jgi:hypothetical protein
MQHSKEMQYCVMDLMVMDLKVEIGPLFLLGYLPG